MTAFENWHEQWVTATRTLEVARLDLTTALHELPPEQLGALRRYRERVDGAQRDVDRLAQGKPRDTSAPLEPSAATDIWPVVKP
jgi:hypothetical protein